MSPDTPARSKRTRFTPARYKDYSHDIKIETDLEIPCNVQDIDKGITNSSLCELAPSVGASPKDQDMNHPSHSEISETLQTSDDEGKEFAGKNRDGVVHGNNQNIENPSPNARQKTDISKTTTKEQIVCSNNSTEKELYVEIQLSEESGHIVPEFLSTGPQEITLNQEVGSGALTIRNSKDLLGEKICSKNDNLDIVLKQECEPALGKRTRGRPFKSKDGYIKSKPPRSKEEIELLEEKYKEFCIKVETVVESEVTKNSEDKLDENTASKTPENIGPKDVRNETKNESESNSSIPPENENDNGSAENNEHVINIENRGSSGEKKENAQQPSKKTDGRTEDGTLKSVKSNLVDGSYQCPLCDHTTKHVGFFDRHMTVVSFGTCYDLILTLLNIGA